MAGLNELSACEVVERVAQGRATVQQVVRDCVERIAAREPDVQAWQHFDATQALGLARGVDSRTTRGALRGATFGIKDIIDTCDMPTEYGSPIYAGCRPRNDAACVALGRSADGVLLGKTVTTEFANRHPGKTMHPHDRTRTPGGSSSGSAAAVADCMVHLAIGTQTTASTIRPASFCGVVGYRPTFGEISCSGVRQASGSVDTVGLFARTVDDIALYRNVLLGLAPEPLPAEGATRLRIGFCRTHFWDQLEPGVAQLFEDAARRLSAAGVVVGDVTLPEDFLRIEEAHRWVTSFEFARNFNHEITCHWEKISPALRGGRLRDGMDCPFDRYLESLALLEHCREQLAAVISPFDALLTAPAAGEAPVGLQSTGNASFCAIWTSMHVPAVTVPVFTGPNRLPIGAQLIGARHDDHRLLSVSRSIRRLLS